MAIQPTETRRRLLFIFSMFFGLSENNNLLIDAVGENLRGHANHILPSTNGGIEAKKGFFPSSVNRMDPQDGKERLLLLIVKTIE